MNMKEINFKDNVSVVFNEVNMISNKIDDLLTQCFNAEYVEKSFAEIVDYLNSKREEIKTEFLSLDEKAQRFNSGRTRMIVSQIDRITSELSTFLNQSAVQTR